MNHSSPSKYEIWRVGLKIRAQDNLLLDDGWVSLSAGQSWVNHMRLSYSSIAGWVRQTTSAILCLMKKYRKCFVLCQLVLVLDLILQVNSILLCTQGYSAYVLSGIRFHLLCHQFMQLIQVLIDKASNSNNALKNTSNILAFGYNGPLI